MSDIAYRICKNPDCGHRFRDHTSMKTENVLLDVWATITNVHAHSLFKKNEKRYELF